MAGKEKNKPASAEGSGEAKSDAALREEAVLQFWQDNKIFSKTLSASKGKKEFIFYEGPPTANAKPALHHLEARAFKDAIPRYKTMRGFSVRRKAGWDTHGLPVELQIEKELGLNSKKAIEEYGVAKFNRECKESVWEYLDVWNKFTKRIGFWLDQDDPYVTYENDYIESVWNVVKKVDEQKLLYKDYKVVPWCPRCGTALSSHELAQGYEDVKDLSLYVKLKIKKQDNTYFLAWTTTPWTLPGNVALAVGKDIDYVKAKIGEEIYILAKERLAILTEPYQIVGEMKGKDLVGLEYEPLFPFLASSLEPKALAPAFKVYTADFVNTEDGTGIVHTAVMYGQDDFELGIKVGLPKHHLVGLDGKFLPSTGFLEGRFVKEKDEKGKPTLDVDIIKYLTDKNLFFKKQNYQHSYPHCWRCHTALIYYARDSWYIEMSNPKIKEKLISENRKIKWEPAHIRDGRFGEWLREIKDWAISRERYWGTPLPVWQCAACKKIEVVGGIEDLKAKTKKSGNKYFVMRHGGTEANLKGVVSFSKQASDELTTQGQEQVALTAEGMIGKKIDLIVSSPFTRTRETAAILQEKLGLSEAEVVFDDRLQEINVGDFDGKSWGEYHRYVQSVTKGWFSHKIPGGESLQEVEWRTGAVLYELENKYQDKNILIVTHGALAWLLFINAGLYIPDNKPYQLPNVEAFVSDFKQFRNAEMRELPFVPTSHNENYELDLHKPYIDEIALVCAHSISSGQACGGNLVRTREVMDVWFDSGCMPFAQDHYPFEDKRIAYPADFISEAIDQTRGWFYTLHAVGILMGRGRAYKNVICLGHLLDAKGKKMSKSLGNIVDPWEAMDKYGVDTLRLWMYSVNQPGESKNFDEKTVALLNGQIFGLFYNVLAFYELYRDRSLEAITYNLEPINILDQWILARLDELLELTTLNLDSYKLLEPVRGIRDFISDLSTWYLRRSRERIKEGDMEAKQCLYFILKTLAKIMAPLAPFTAEDVWLKLKTTEDPESVHLANWPTKKFRILFFAKPKVLEKMETVRRIITLGLEARQKAGIKVRQPLTSLKLKVASGKLSSEYIELIKDELNVKEFVVDNSIANEVELDTNITSALKAEGEYREFMRELQDERKKMGLNPNDKMPLSIERIYKKYKIMPSLQAHMLRVAAVASLICDNFSEPLPKEEIITACLLHDMGNIIKSNFEFLPQFLEPEGPEYWQKVKDDYIKKYGRNDIEATLKIIKELGLSEKIFRFTDQVRFSLLCNHRDGKDWDIKIIHYSDGRADPYGIVSYDERMKEAKKRYENKENSIKEDEWQKLVACGQEIEKQIFSKCKIKPEDINDQTVAPIISMLRDFVIS